MDEQLAVPNHHADYPGFAGVAGLVAALSMASGRKGDARLAVRLSGMGSSDTVVDIGCGPGVAVRYAARRGAMVTGVDPAPVMLRVARLLTWRPGEVRYVEGATEAIPLPEGSASVVWSIATVHHWSDIDAGLREMRRVLRPGGRLVAMERRTQRGARGHQSHGSVSYTHLDVYKRQRRARPVLRSPLPTTESRTTDPDSDGGEDGTGRPAPALGTVELALTGMHCNACATRIERTLARDSSVVSASVNLATERAFVAYQPDSSGPDALCALVERIGYGATPLASDAPVVTRLDPDHWMVRAAVSWPLALAALLVDLIGPENALAGWSVLVLALLVEVLGAWPFLRTAARLLRHGTTSMDTLITIGTLAALAVSAVEAIALGGKHLHLGGGGAFAARLHGAMAPLIVAILATGRAIEVRVRARAARALHALISLRPPTARVVADADDEEGELVPPESVPVGALVRVRPTEAVPLDGTCLLYTSRCV